MRDLRLKSFAFAVLLGAAFPVLPDLGHAQNKPTLSQLEAAAEQAPLPEDALPSEEEFPLDESTPPAGELTPEPDTSTGGETVPHDQKATNTTTDTPYSKAAVVFLEKRTGKSELITLKVGESTTRKDLSIALKACRKKTTESHYPLTAAFLEVIPLSSPTTPDKRISLDDILNKAPSSSKIFSGWMFAEHPSKTVFDHPLYDVWLSRCFNEN